MKPVEELTEIYVAAPKECGNQEVLREFVSAVEVGIDQWLDTVGNDFICHDRDLKELSFAVSQKYETKKLEGPARAYKVQISIKVDEIKNGKS